MPNVRIGKYKRPGIFLEEYDQSVIVSPEVEGITNLILGVSKKGPVNTPMRITGIQEFEALYGQIDRNLERKGSFFHRTVMKMLETAPVYAINLLMTDDDLDKAEFQSLSTATCGINGEKHEGAYRRYFDTTGFWKRDPEAFLNLAKSFKDIDKRDQNSHTIAISNLSGHPISVFIVKTKRTGFDRTIIEWYGGKDKMPPYLNERDYASDYMVDVIVVGGDWNDYEDLSVDSRWSKYFNRKGLRKEQVDNFANDNNVNLLAYYNGVSLIPYFRDGNGQNIFIETVINRETDRTGLFCSIDYDMIEQDFYTGAIDLLGHNLAGTNSCSEVENIKFLSYEDKIVENVLYTETPLDLPGNVFTIGGTVGEYDNQDDHAFGGGVPKTEGVVENYERTYWFAEQSVYGVTQSVYTPGSTQSVVEYTIAEGAYAVIGGVKVDLNTSTASVIKTFTFDIDPGLAPGEYSNVYYITDQGEVKVNNPTSANMAPDVNHTDIVLGYTYLSITSSNGTASIVGTASTMNEVSVGVNGFIDNVSVVISNPSNNDEIEIDFTDIDNVNRRSYKEYRNFKYYTYLLDMLTSHKKNELVLLLNTKNGYEKYNLKDISVTHGITSSGYVAPGYVQNDFTTKGGIITIKFNDNEIIPNVDNTTPFITDNRIVLYKTDNEFIPGKKGAESSYVTDIADRTSMGVIGKYSEFYKNYYNGIINTGDVIYNNITYDIYTYGETMSMSYINGETATQSQVYTGNDYIILDKPLFGTINTIATGEYRIYNNSIHNKEVLTIISETGYDPMDAANDLGFNGKYAYQVDEDVEDEFDVTIAYNTLDGRYIPANIQDRNNKIIIEEIYIRDTDNTIFVKFDGEYSDKNTVFYVRSGISNLKQTLELEIPADDPTYYVTRQKNQVIISTNRYTEIRPGDFLLAEVDEDNKRKMTRIISKRRYNTDPSLSVITTDAAIAITDFDLQTMAFTEIDKYVKEYKALTFKGFKVREDSLPDGTEERQNQILNMVAKGTPLFKAITNKESFVFRYLIDSFGLGLTELSKQQLMDITGERLDSFTFLNMPSMKSLKSSSSPTFVDSEGVIDFKFVAQGGDYDSNPAFLYSFGEGRGVSTSAYFLPYITVNDNGRPMDMPPASHVATTYMRKHLSNITSVTPWTVAAGITNGKVTGITGTEQEFGLEDIEHLNMAMMNPIVYKRNRGYVIETENTAQTLYKSALSYIHVREVLIELEQELAAMLLDYQWKYNTPDVRAEIKLRADVICETYVSRNGIYNFFNKMDEENNTPEIIDNQMGVISTYIEPIRAMGVIVNNVTILGTGAIDSGGFIM